jgi:hypothetical protein
MDTNRHELIVPADPIPAASVSGLVRVTCKRRVQREVLLKVHLFSLVSIRVDSWLMIVTDLLRQLALFRLVHRRQRR